jgi:hypothetical protein
MTHLIGSKDKFAIEFWCHPEYREWGSYCLWFENQKIGELNEWTDVALSTLEITLQDIIKDRMDLFDTSFVAKTDEQIIDIVWNSIYNHDMLEIQSLIEIKNLGRQYGKFVFTNDIPTDDYFILNIYLKQENQFKFLIKKHLKGKEEGLEDIVHCFCISEQYLINVTNEYSRKIKSLLK